MYLVSCVSGATLCFFIAHPGSELDVASCRTLLLSLIKRDSEFVFPSLPA